MLTQSIVEAQTLVTGTVPAPAPPNQNLPLHLPSGLHLKIGAGKTENISVTSATGNTVDILVTDGSKNTNQGGALVPYIVQA